MITSGNTEEREGWGKIINGASLGIFCDEGVTYGYHLVMQCCKLVHVVAMEYSSREVFATKIETSHH